VNGDHDGFRIDVTLADGEAEVRLALDAEGRLRPAEKAQAATRLGLLVRTDPAPADADPSPARRPERAFALVLAMSLHDGLSWAGRPDHEPGEVGAGPEAAAPEPPEPIPDPAADPDPVGRDSIEMVSHCYSTGYHWGDRVSAFFEVWGGRDFFNLLAMTADDHHFVFHGSRDCPIARAANGLSLMRWAGPYGESDGAGERMPRTLVTDVDDTSVVFGGSPRLERAVEQAHAAEGRIPIRVTFGCEYDIVGDDVQAVCGDLVCRGFRVELLNPPIPRFTDATARSWWKDFLDRTGAAGREKAPRTVNLAGLGWERQRGVREVGDLLGRAGVRVAATFFPGASAASRARIGEACLTVASPWAPVMACLVPLLRERGIEVITPTAPYGEAGTRAWVNEVCAALRLAPPDDAAWRGAVEDLAPDLARLRVAAGDLTVGLVADVGPAGEMCTPRFFFGFDPVRLLLDLGFRVRVIGNKAGGATAEALGLSEDLAARYDSVTVELRDRDPDPGLLRAHGIDLVYCDKAAGAEAKAQGVVPFGISHLEPGLAGAERSVSRLLAMSRQRLYADHGHLLRGADPGDRHGP
jgi:hypothetical protein